MKKITISIDAELLRQLEAEARKEKRKLSEFIRLLIESKGEDKND